MKSARRLLIATTALAFVAACAQQEEPVQVQVEPIYDKYGNVVYMPAEAGAVGAAVVPVAESGGSRGVPTDDGGSTAPGDDDDGSDDDGGDDGGDGGDGNGNQNQNENRNQNQNQNQTNTGNQNNTRNNNQNQAGG